MAGLFESILDNIKITGSGGKTGKQQIVGAPSGITSEKETINLQGSAEIPITNNVDFLLDGQNWYYCKGFLKINERLGLYRLLYNVFF